MLEGLAAWVLNTYIGEYLENLNTDQLSIGLLQGYAELENVPLKRSALRKFDVPLCVRAGVIGKLTLSVPLTHLKSEPWVVTVNDLYIILEPSHNHYDVEFEAQYHQEKKKAQLDALELLHKKRLAEGSGSIDQHTVVENQQAPSGSGWWAYGASVVSTIVENIQLIVTNVHLRYEDGVTIPGCSFACGVKIGRLSVQSATSSWAPGFVVRHEGENMRKLVELKDFSMYWDNENKSELAISGLPTTVSWKELVQKMKELDEQVKHQYLLSPLGLSVKMEKNTSKIPLKTSPPSPRFKFDLEPDRVSIQGSKKQFVEVRLVLDEWQRYQRGKPYRKWRPKAALSRVTARQWWKFAIICHLERIRQRNERGGWRYAISRARQVNAYCRAYIRSLASRPKEFSKADEALMRQIEREYEFDELLLLREAAMRYGLRTGQLCRGLFASAQMNRDFPTSPSASSLSMHTPPEEMPSSPPPTDASRGYFSGWLSSWWSAGASSHEASSPLETHPIEQSTLTDDTQLRQEIEKMEQVLEEELWDMYNETVDDSAVMGRDLLFAAVSLSMKSLNIAFAGEYSDGDHSGTVNEAGLTEVPRCLTDACLDVSLRVRYLTDPDDRNVVTPCFELSSTFASGLNLQFDSKQYESAMQALTGWSGKSEDDVDERKVEKATGGKQRPSLTTKSTNISDKKKDRKDRVDFKLTADVQIPKLKVDLRTDFSTDACTVSPEGQPLVTILCEKLGISYKKTKPHICVVETVMESLLVLDRMDANAKSTTPPHMLKVRGAVVDESLERLDRSFLSTSCPDISCDGDTDDSSPLSLSTSLPTAAVSYSPLFSPPLKLLLPATPPPTPTAPYGHRRRSDDVAEKDKSIRSGAGASGVRRQASSEDKKRGNERRRTRRPGEFDKPGPIRVIVTLVDSVHQEFYNAFKQVGTLINVEAGDAEFVVNEQTLILLLDFFGLLAPLPSTDNTALQRNQGLVADADVTLSAEHARGKKAQLEAHLQTLKVVMKTAGGSNLGSIIADYVQTCLVSDAVGFSLNGRVSTVRLTDETPLYSRMYPERLNFTAEGDKNLQFLLYKYKNTDQELKREFDACLALYADDDVHYVHTQRYLLELIQFWNHFIQVYDFYANAKAVRLGREKPNGVGHGFRLKIRIDLRGTKVFLPISALDTALITAEMTRLVADNDFLFSSLLEAGLQSTSPDGYDCLVDVLQLHLEDVQLHESTRLADDERDAFSDATRRTETIFAKGSRELVDFKGFSIVVDPEPLLVRPLSVDVSVARNLDTHLARAVPDIAVHLTVNSANLRLSVDTYAILRGILEQNLGEEVPSQYSSPTISQLASACDTTAVWTNQELTCDLNDVQVDCYTRDPNSALPIGQYHLAQVDFTCVKFSFESFSDGVRHIDLICNEARVIDARFEGEAANKRENVFPIIFASCDCDADSKGHRKRDKLLTEVHYAMERNCSTLTLVFSRARLLFVSEWLELAKAFLMVEAPGRKVTQDEWKRSIAGTDAYPDKRKLEKWKSHHADALAKTRVLTRAALEDMKKDNFKLKATLQESEIVFLEKPSSRNSLAVVFKATASVYFENVDECIKFECRDSQLQLFDCVYGNKDETSTALTNSFSCVSEFSTVSKTSRTSKYVNLGLLETLPHAHEYRLKMTVSDMATKLSYRDWLALRAVWEAYTANWQQPTPVGSQRADDAGLIIEKVELKLESVSVCFLDDYQETRFPLFKVCLNDAIIEHSPGKSSRDSQEGSAALLMEMNYFNQRVYGWEPFLEAWRVDNLSWSYNPDMNSLSLEILGDKLLDVTLTKTFIQQTRHFLNHWPSLSESLAKDFRSGFTRRLDILPYLLVNQTGSVLRFATCLSSQKRGSSTRKMTTSKWMHVGDGETCEFSFQADPWQLSEADSVDPFLSHHMVIQVDGWHEITPIPVDAVGTFFRLARLDSSKKSALSHAASHTRVVAAVSIDRDGRKVVTVRSALMFVNGFRDALTVRLEASGFVGEHTEFVLVPGAVRAAPLAYASAKVLVRPTTAGSSWSYCKAITWGHISQQQQVANYVRTCTSMEGHVYRMCVSVKAEAYPEISVAGGAIPGHTLSFVPPVVVTNLLPLDLHLNVTNPSTRATIPAGQWAPFVDVDPLEPIELKFETEYFHSRQCLYIYPTAFQEQQHELEMVDQLRRPLILQAKLTPIKGGAVKVTISAPFWFVNRSGLPLIVKQEASEEAAGQFEEHEHARSMTPVLFSFAENGAPFKSCLRLGKLVHPDCLADWCRSFVLEPGITFKELRSIPVNDRRPARVYNIGVEVRAGQGVYKDTKVVLLTARYLIDNRSRFKLHISQLYEAERTTAGQYTVAPNCTLAWHWPRQDLDLLLCVRRDDLPYWSSPFRIDQLKSFHLTFRDSQFTPQFLRLEIILRGAVYYVTFSSAENIPPPIRIENLTDAPILYNQKSCDASHLRAVLRPHTKVNYSFDDTQFKPPVILLTAQNGKAVEYDLTVLGQGEPLLYENFIYIAFAKTFDESPRRNPDETELVLDVLPQGKVILQRKDSQRPQQLWRMTSDGHLVNAGDWSHLMKRTGEDGVAYVLDVLPNQCDPGSLIPLMLRPMDASRRVTQRWRFTEDNRLMCNLANMYVQAERCQLKASVATMLGPTQMSAQSVGGVPNEQLIIRHRQRPGSGRLAVTVLLDGPTRVLRVTDMADQQRHLYQPLSSKHETDSEQGTGKEQWAKSSEKVLELACSCTLNAGAGFSVVNTDMEELVYCRLTGLILNARREKGKYTLGVKVLQIQADNQLWNAERWTFLHIRSKFDEKHDPTFLALDLLVQWMPLPSYDSFDTFIVSINKVALYMDEMLLWKIILFFSDDMVSAGDAVAALTHSASNEWSKEHSAGAKLVQLYQHSPPPNLELERPDPKEARRCYFGILNLSCRRLYLSVVTANVLPPQLRQLKQMYNMPLIRFENASVEIAPFQQSYYFETLNFLLEALHKHFTQELRGQAVKILGTVDFLGNPVGLFRDVSDSLQELIISANVSGFVTGIMHGFSNSAAKITSSLSDQVGKIAMDDGHRQLRESVRQSQSQDAMGHLLTGVKGLGIGVVGGVTSVFIQPVDGMKKDGIEGLFTGVVKGVVGMVAKPVQGVLDLATGVSNATKEAVSGSDGPMKSRFPPGRLRFPRVTRNLQGTLPPYSEQLAAAQRTLLSINDGNQRELCLSLSHCCTLQQHNQVLVLISTSNVYFVRRRRQEDARVLLNMAYSKLQGCTCVLENSTMEATVAHGLVNWQQPYLEFSLKSADPQNGKRRIKCDSMERATELCQKILYAKQQYEEQERSLAVPEHYGIDQV